VGFLVPGVLTVALMSTGLVTLGISTAYQRYYRVLKRLGGTPLTRGGLASAKATATILVEVAQVVLLLVIASLFLNWSAQGSLALAIPVLVLGAITFAGLGLTLAGALRAELTLGSANGLYLLFLILGGVVLPIDHLPSLIQPLARVLPPTVLSASLRSILQGASPSAFDLALLAAWAVALGALATWRFRWE
ncbi:MAG: ABC transporter permease, partial [Terriglobales bacterium]